MRIGALFVTALSLGVLDAASARANGRFPASDQIVFSPSDPNLIVLRATFGALVSHDHGSSWQWLCEDVLRVAPTAVEDPSIGLTSSNALVAGVHAGLGVSSDTGCNWAFAGGPLSQQGIFDVVVRPDNPNVVLAGASTFQSSTGDAGGGEAGVPPGYASQMFQSTDDGANWSPLGMPFDPNLVVTTFDVSASDPSRLYVAGFNASTTPRSFWLLESGDAGGGWTELPLPLDAGTDQAPYVAAVDPTNRDRVYVRTQGSPSRLLVSQDGGQSFQEIFSLLNLITGFALSPDGTTIYAGSLKDGLYASQASAASFQKVSSLQVGCLAARAGELWACSSDASGFAVGMSTDNGATFAPKLRFRDIQGPLACGAGAAAAACGVSSSAFSTVCNALNQCFGTGPLPPEYEGGPPAPLSTLCRSGPGCPCRNLDACLVDDGGSGDGGGDSGGDADASTPPRGQASAPRGGCGCSVAGGGSAAGILAAGVLAAAFARRRRGSGFARRR